jgi:hypothetical protein
VPGVSTSVVVSLMAQGAGTVISGTSPSLTSMALRSSDGVTLTVGLASALGLTLSLGLALALGLPLTLALAVAVGVVVSGVASLSPPPQAVRVMRAAAAVARATRLREKVTRAW